MIGLRTGKGLGDALYLRAAVLHLLSRGEQVTVYTKWPDVFSDLPVSILDLEQGYRSENVIRFASSVYTEDPVPGIDEFQECCRNIGIAEPIELRLDWRVKNQPLLDDIKRKAGDRKIFIYQSPRVAKNGDQVLTTPILSAFNKVVSDYHEYFRIRLGHPRYVIDDASVPRELDMFGKGLILDTLDICTIGDLFFGQPCFVTVVGPAMGKNCIAMFPRRAIESEGWVRRLTPEFCIHHKELTKVIYDA